MPGNISDKVRKVDAADATEHQDSPKTKLNEEAAKDIVAALKDTCNALSQPDQQIQLKELSDHTIHNASIFQDTDSVKTSVIIYASYKILSRSQSGNYDGNKSSSFAKKLIALLSEAANHLGKKNISGFRNASNRAMNLISQQDSRLKLFIEEVIEQAGIRKSSNIYRHGISMGRAAELLGLSLYDVMQYVGATNITENYGNIRQRILNARRLFR